MPANRVKTIQQVASSRISAPAAKVPPGFVMVPAQFFQSQGTQPSDWQRNLYAAAFEQARRAVMETRQRLYQRAQVVVLN